MYCKDKKWTETAQNSYIGGSYEIKGQYYMYPSSATICYNVIALK
jgi:hypothetical protein